MAQGMKVSNGDRVRVQGPSLHPFFYMETLTVKGPNLKSLLQVVITCLMKTVAVTVRGPHTWLNVILSPSRRP